jgi:hypothetical protein
LGRWLSRDPIEETGGLNLYVLLLNDPVNLLDFLGLIEDKDGYLYLGMWSDPPGLTNITASPTGEQVPFGKKKGWNKVGIAGEYFNIEFSISGKLSCQKFCGEELIKEWDVPFSFPLHKKVGVGVGLKLKVPYVGWIVTIFKSGKWTYEHRKEISEGVKYTILINDAREKYQEQIDRIVSLFEDVEVADSICMYSSIPPDVLIELHNIWGN